MTYNEAFQLIDQQSLPDVNSEGYLFEHKKTAAKIVFMLNKDDNKTFSINFSTPPYDDNGIAHIIEHSVLCGSKNYPSKEPFVELAKGSLNTFLNAMTFSDKTMYPVASRNHKDFNNLMDVYLDAVFFPNFYDKETTLMQEGWHYHLENKEDDLIYKGVVYNEMKGALSGPETILFRNIESALFPDTIYRHESGGDPVSIPTLTQQKFLDFHQTYYHPSNAYVFMYGDLNINEQLSRLDKVLDQFDMQHMAPIEYDQRQLDTIKNRTLYYSVAEEEQTDNKFYFNMSYAINNVTDNMKYWSLLILSDVLFADQSSPLKKALLESKLSEDIFGGFEDMSMKHGVFSITAKHISQENIETFNTLVITTLQNIVEQGLDLELIEAKINRAEFNLRESANQEGYPKGVIYAVSALSTWLYDVSPFERFKIEPLFKELRQLSQEGYFESLIEQYLLNNQHQITLTLVPKANLIEQKEQELHQQLQVYKAQLSEEQLDDMVATTQRLLEEQNREDNEEDLAKIPLLTLQDLDRNVEELAITVKDHEVKYLHYEGPTSGISYVRYYFDANTLTLEDLPYATLAMSLLAYLETDNYTIDQLIIALNKQVGGINYDFSILSDKDNNLKFIVEGKALESKLPELVALIFEILLHTNFDNKSKIYERLLILKSRYEMQFNRSGHMVAIQRLSSYVSSQGKIADLLQGYSYYQFLVDTLNSFEENYDQLLARLTGVMRKLVTPHQLIIGVTGNQATYQQVQTLMPTYLAQLHLENESYQELQPKYQISNEAFVANEEVNYVAQGGNFKELGFNYTGALKVLKTILSYDYLWQTIRVQGGAYGAFNVSNRNGLFALASYRDPNIDETLTSYSQLVEYIQTFDINERQMTKYIIGTVSELDSSMSVATKGRVAFNRYLINRTVEELQQERNEVLDCTSQKIRDLAELVRACLQVDAYCVVGNSTKIDTVADKFKEIKPLIKH